MNVKPPVSAVDVFLEVTECQVVPDGTARFPFTIRGSGEIPSIHDFTVTSDNQNFDPAWAHVIGINSQGSFPGHCILEVRPTGIRRGQFGRYPLRITLGVPGTLRYAEGTCLLIIKPCLRVTVWPTVQVRPAGELTLSLENCGGTSLDISLTIRHKGSSWSKGWEFELDTEDGPFEFSEQFDPPPDAKGSGEFELDISAEGIPLVQATVKAGHARLSVSRKLAVTAAVVLAGAAAGIIAALIHPSASLLPQKIVFISAPPPGPVPHTRYHVAVSGGASGSPVTLSIDPSATSACSISGRTVTFRQAGRCLIDANQAGNARYAAAPQARQSVHVTSRKRRPRSGALTPQKIAFISAPPPDPFPQSTYQVSVSGGASGNPVTVSIDSSATTVCSISGRTVTFGQPGNCIIDADQAGNHRYAAAAQVQQAIQVGKAAQSISFTVPGAGQVGQSAALSAAAGGSGNPVVFSVDPSLSTQGACVVSGANGATVNYTGAGSCVIDANEAGSTDYLAAPQVQQAIQVNPARGSGLQ